MESKAIKVVVIDGKKVEKTITLQPGAAPEAVSIDGIPDGKYILVEDGSNVAPENITVKRVGDDLYISTEGSDTEHPQLIIREFYKHPGTVIGMGEDGAYHDYVDVYGHDSQVLNDASPVPLALGDDNVAAVDGLYAAAADSDGIGYLPLLAGLGALGLLGGAAVALAHHNNSDDSNVSASNSTDVPDTSGNSDNSDTPNTSDNSDTPNTDVVVQPGTLDSAIDDVGSIAGEISATVPTDDNKPTFNGSGVEPGNTIIIHDTDGSVIGSTTANDDGTWAYTPTDALSDGEHDISVVVEDPNGNTSVPSNTIIIDIDTVAPGAVTDKTLSDDVGSVQGEILPEGTTDDNQPAYAGKAEAGGVVTIYDNGTEIGTAVVGDDGNWSFTPATPLADGQHSYTTTVTDIAGNQSSIDDPYNFTVIPPAPEVLTVNDNVGTQQGELASGDVTDDNKPVITGNGAIPDDIITIYDNDTVIGSAVVDANGDWSVTPAAALDDGTYDFTATQTDAEGQASASSSDFAVTIDTSSSVPPVPSGPLVSGEDNFDTDSKYQFSAVGDSVTLDSGITMTYLKEGVDGSAKNTYTEITNKGLGLLVPDFGAQALVALANSSLRVDFGGETDAVSFKVQSANFPGSSVAYFDANGEQIFSQDIPVVGSSIAVVDWHAPQGQSIAYIEINVGAESASDVAIRMDDFKWGDSVDPLLLSSVQHAAIPDVTSAVQGIEGYSLHSVLDTATQQVGNVVQVSQSRALDINDLLSHASKDLFVKDGHQQVELSGNDSHLSAEGVATVLHNAQWTETGSVQAGGVTYDVYNHDNSSLDVFVQHDNMHAI
ncbi:Ig-like domain repeat protein [Buttiauxella sp. B2]|uniref:Ig-like domain-containing protein n=1 Tax=Buttiauxella sp. B2 TaxID=2587812 RepID=UPI00111F8870|nr:Ig-like domain-containing protein [Buttiauxella sp. B2]TNV11861.1 Ig-like domain repeat protein [Buttiauxella sp. B2]